MTCRASGANTPVCVTLVLIALLARASAVAVPPPPVQVTASCEARTYASDQLVCEDSELRKLDTLLAGLIAGRSVRGGVSSGGESDEAWFRRSRTCAFERDHRACLLAAYCDRIALLAGTEGKRPTECQRPARDQRPPNLPRSVEQR